MTELWWDRFPDRASARRAVARSLHPDVGGDPIEFAAAMAMIDRRFGGRRGAPTCAVEVLIRPSRRGALRSRARSVRRLYTRARTRLPLKRRRYFLL